MDNHEILEDAVNPAEVPQRILYTGAKMPGVGIGTFGSDRFGADDIANAVEDAVKSGYRLIDCASCYGNEDKIGIALENLSLIHISAWHSLNAISAIRSKISWQPWRNRTQPAKPTLRITGPVRKFP